MYVIVVGGGDVGESVTKRLEKHGVKVTLIDKSEKVCEHLIQVTKANIIHGDATNPRVLEGADTSKADFFIAVTGDDRTNLIISLLARKYGAKNIIVRIAHPVYIEVCKMLGISNVINPAETAAIQIDAIIRGIKLIELASIVGKDIYVEEIEVDKSLDGAESVEVYKELRDASHPVVIIREDKVLLPEPGLKLKKGDKLLIVRKRRKFPLM